MIEEALPPGHFQSKFLRYSINSNALLYPLSVPVEISTQYIAHIYLSRTRKKNPLIPYIFIMDTANQGHKTEAKIKIFTLS